MPVGNAAPMLGARAADRNAPWQLRERRFAERDAWRADLATEAIEDFAIEPEDFGDWGDRWDIPGTEDNEFWDRFCEWDEDDDWLGHRTYRDLLTEDHVDITTLTDRDGVPGWGTELDRWEDLSGFTITRAVDARGHARCPWGWSTGTKS